ncbi:PKD domain-containing protein [Actinoplanes sp. NPDC024001]|uniref:PKD domain-containing protein n=1 Tax=Actinoplanes sp. NPDC024001 TaxID=3154598 RepID=UPI0033E14F55
MRRSWAAACTALLIGSILTVTTQNAAAAPARDDQIITVVKETTPDKRSAVRRLAPDRDPSAVAFERMRLAKRPTFGPGDCHGSPLAWEPGGLVVNHFRYCEVRNFTALSLICVYWGPTGCLRHKELGRADFRYTLAGHGWDASMDPGGADPASNQISWVGVLDNWTNVWGLAKTLPLSMELVCEARTDTAPCRSAGPAEVRTTRSVPEWQSNPRASFRVLEAPLDGGGVDNLAYFNFHIRLTYGNVLAQSTLDTAGNSFRCDHAIYLRGQRGCVFDAVSSYFDKLDLNPSSNNYEEAKHVFDAFFDPASTEPRAIDKDVPGNLDGRNVRPLTRAYELYNQALYDANNADAVRVCIAVWGPNYPQNDTRDCDEYPFRSTHQGSSTTPTHFSARPILQGHNRSGGASLGNWYRSERILEEDPFYVVLSFSGDSGIGTPDVAPRVDAGPDTGGVEGSGTVLRGSASDVGSTPASRWSYAPGAGVDPGAICAFGDATAPVTTFTCTDDGTFTVTLTADDGANPPVSDSAVVTVDNATPELALGAAPAETRAAAAAEPGPEPWSVFRAGGAVSLRAPFTDPGSNDTQTCRISWDDGTTETVTAEPGRCVRDHVYADPGMYTIRLTVRDDDTGEEQSTTMVVVYDPDAGFATTGAWLDSPAGALTADPTATGRLMVNLNPKYKPGESGPAPGGGKVTARLKGIDFELDATALDWLVVTPDDRVAVKGTGRVNGAAGYGFVAYGYDTPDRLRLVVWPLSSGEHPGSTTVYDNRASADYDLDLADPQPIGGGSVQAHR